MLKQYSLVLCLLWFNSIWSQVEEPPYYPQEILVHPDCAQSEDPASCLNDVILNRISQAARKFFSKYQQDTLTVDITLFATEKGSILKKYLSVRSNSKVFSEAYAKGLEKFLLNLPRFDILHRKTDPWVSRHLFSYGFVQASDVGIQQIDRPRPYTGGTIQELPVFPGCSDMPDKANCFTQKFREHVSTNFKYPKEAMAEGIEGTVYVQFTISKTGTITNVKHKGPDPRLNTEALRIISLLPKMEQPARLNGDPVKIPFSIPIIFKLEGKRKSRE